jgi:hypothetical protein
MRNFQYGRLIASRSAPLGASAMGRGRREVGQTGLEPGRSRMAAARYVLAGTTTAALTGAAAGALGGTAATIMTGAAAMAVPGIAWAAVAAPGIARGPPYGTTSWPQVPEPRAPRTGITPTPKTNGGPMAATTGPTPTQVLPLHRKRRRGKPIFYLRNSQFGSVPKPLTGASLCGVLPVSALATIVAALATGVFLGVVLTATCMTSVRSWIQQRRQRKFLDWQRQAADAREAPEQSARSLEAVQASPKSPTGREW